MSYFAPDLLSPKASINQSSTYIESIGEDTKCYLQNCLQSPLIHFKEGTYPYCPNNASVVSEFY